jgi:hypothetical protein
MNYNLVSALSLTYGLRGFTKQMAGRNVSTRSLCSGLFGLHASKTVIKATRTSAEMLKGSGTPS